jgi:hypothetical protein
VERIEYMTTVWDGDNIAQMLDSLNELGTQGWKVCALVNAKAGSDVIGRVQPGVHQVQLLLLERDKEA